MMDNTNQSQQQQHQVPFIIQNGKIYQLATNFPNNTNINKNNMFLTNNNFLNNKVTIIQQPSPQALCQQQMNNKKIVYKAEYQQVTQQQYQKKTQLPNVLMLMPNKNDQNINPQQPSTSTVVNNNNNLRIGYASKNQLTKKALPQVTQTAMKSEILNKAMINANNQLETVKVNPIDMNKLNQHMTPDARVFKKLLKAPQLFKKKSEGQVEHEDDILTYKTVTIGSVEHIVLDNDKNLTNYAGDLDSLKRYAYQLATKLRKPVTIPGFLLLKDSGSSKTIENSLDSFFKKPIYVNKTMFVKEFEEKSSMKKEKEAENRKRRKIDNEPKYAEKRACNSVTPNVVNIPIDSSTILNEDVINPSSFINDQPITSNNIVDNNNENSYFDNLVSLTNNDLDQFLTDTIQNSNFDDLLLDFDPTLFLSTNTLNV